MTGPTRLPNQLLAGFSAMVLGHGLGYLVAHPHGRDRALVLQSTGHSYWSMAVTVAVVGGLTAVAAAAHRGGRRGAGYTAAGTPGGATPASLLRLAGLQAAVFVAVEVLERVVAGAPLGGLVLRPELLLGVAFQVVTVAMLYWLLARAESLAAALVTRLRRPLCEPRRPRHPRFAPLVVPTRVGVHTIRLRGPPELAR